MTTSMLHRDEFHVHKGMEEQTKNSIHLQLDHYWLWLFLCIEIKAVEF